MSSNEEKRFEGITTTAVEAAGMDLFRAIDFLGQAGICIIEDGLSLPDVVWVLPPKLVGQTLTTLIIAWIRKYGSKSITNTLRFYDQLAASIEQLEPARIAVVMTTIEHRQKEGAQGICRALCNRAGIPFNY